MKRMPVARAVDALDRSSGHFEVESMSMTCTGKRVRSFGIGFLLLLGLTACSCSTSQSGTISGQLQRVGGPSVAAGASPLSGEVTLTSSTGGITRVRVPPSGRFSASVPAGSYQLTGSSPSVNDGKLVCVATPETVSIPASSAITRDVRCHIR